MRVRKGITRFSGYHHFFNVGAKSLLLICASFFLLTQGALSQVVVAGTDFEATASKQGVLYTSADNVDQYGIVAGTLTPGQPWATGTLNTFNNTYQYLIANNPAAIDPTKYKANSPTDYMYIVSPPPSGYLYHFGIHSARYGSKFCCYGDDKLLQHRRSCLSD